MASWICHPCAAFTVCRGSVPAGKEKSCPSRQKGSRNGCAPKFHKPEKMASQFNISSLSLAGQSVTIIQAGLLALGHRSPRLPDSISDTLRFARQYSGGTAPALHRSSLLSPVGRLYVLFNCGVATPLTRYFKQKKPFRRIERDQYWQFGKVERKSGFRTSMQKSPTHPSWIKR